MTAPVVYLDRCHRCSRAIRDGVFCAACLAVSEANHPAGDARRGDRGFASRTAEQLLDAAVGIAARELHDRVCVHPVKCAGPKQVTVGTARLVLKAALRAGVIQLNPDWKEGA